MKTRNRKPKKNTKSQSQKAKKEKSKEKNGPHQKNQRTPLRNEFEPSAKNHLGEGSNKGLSAQYFRSNLHPIYQLQAQKEHDDWWKLCGGEMFSALKFAATPHETSRNSRKGVRQPKGVKRP